MTLYIVDGKGAEGRCLEALADSRGSGQGQRAEDVELRPSGDNKHAGETDFSVEGKFRAAVALKTAAGEAGKGPLQPRRAIDTRGITAVRQERETVSSVS